MTRLFQNIDQVLRGNYSRPEDLRAGRVATSTGGLVLAALALGLAYGVCMGLYGVLRLGPSGLAQLATTAIKVPLLFLLTLLVTYPSLYVFCALANSRLRFQETSRFLLMGIVVNLALLASFGPITGFFTLSTQSYPFIVLLNVLFFAVSGTAGLLFVHRGMKTIFEPPGTTTSEPPEVNPASEPPVEPTFPRTMLPPRLRPRAHSSIRVFKVWLLIFGTVGAQRGWILRPFIGSPELPFTLFRQRQSNFFEAVLIAFRELFS